MPTNRRPASRAGNHKQHQGTKRTPSGVWNRGTGRGPSNPIRVRTKRRDQIDDDKIALAYWLLAKKIVENGSDRPVTEEEARRVSEDLDGNQEHDSPGGGS